MSDAAPYLSFLCYHSLFSEYSYIITSIICIHITSYLSYLRKLLNCKLMRYEFN